MDSFEFNKIAGATLGTCLFVMALGVFSDAIFARPHGGKAGYDLPGASDHGAAGGAAAAATAEPLPVLLAAADAKRGEGLVKPCAACHAFEKGGAAKVGPPLYGVVGHKVAGQTFAYSDALKGKGGEWTFDQLNAYDVLVSDDIIFSTSALAAFVDSKKKQEVSA